MTASAGETFRITARIISQDANAHPKFDLLLEALNTPFSFQNQLMTDLARRFPLRSLVLDAQHDWISRTTNPTVEKFLGVLAEAQYFQVSINLIREQVLGQFPPISEADAFAQQLAEYGPQVISRRDDIILLDKSAVFGSLCPLLGVHFPESEADINKPEFRTRLHAEIRQNQLLLSAWEAAEAHYSKTPRKHLGEFGQNLSEPTAIILRNILACYTNDHFYSEFNQATRDYDGNNEYPYSAFFNALFSAVMRLQTRPEFGTGDGQGYLYRGAIGYVSPDNQKLIKGSTFAFRQFVSATTNEKVATLFMSAKAGMILWKIRPTMENIRMASLRNISVYPAEDEVLICPFVEYIVEKVTRVGNLTTIQIKFHSLKVAGSRRVEQKDIRNIIKILEDKCLSHPFDIIDAVLADHFGDAMAIKDAYRIDLARSTAYRNMLQYWLGRCESPTFEVLADILREFHMGAADEVLGLASK